MKIGILLADELRDTLKPHFGCYSRMFSDLLAGRDFVFETFTAHQGDYPSSPDACEGYLITGSRHSTYDNLPWIAAMEDFIRRLVAANIPLVGVCFGHQLIAQALGGKVEKATAGWGLGAQTWEVFHAAPWMRPSVPSPENSLTFLSSHQDQVTTLPPDATLLAGSEFCPCAAYAVDSHVFCVQGHPEFRPTFSRILLDYRRDDVPTANWQKAADSLFVPTHNELCAEWVDRFYRRNFD